MSMEKNNDLASVLESIVVRSAKLVYSWKNLFKKNKCVVPAANPDIPEHLMINILTRLPVKTIIRFQCVCKSWQTLITTSDPLFIQTHLARASIDPDNDGMIVRCRNHLQVSSCTSDDHPLLSQNMKIAGSVHGLVCLDWCRWDFSCWATVPYNFVPRIGIWNPVTHMYKDIPPPPPPPPSIAPASLRLSRQMFLTFVFDSSSKDYKVIHITNFKGRNVVAAVYSCNASCWSKTNVLSSFVSWSLISPHGIQVNQSVYWKWKYIRGRHKANLVMSFDIKREVFSLFPGVVFSFFPGVNVYKSTLVNLEDSLACIVHSKALKKTRVDVYVFNQTVKGGSWSKMHTVETISLPRDMFFIQCFRNGDLFFKDSTKFKTVHIDPETHQVVEGSSHSCGRPQRCELRLFSSEHEHDDEYGFRYTQTFAAVTGMNTINIKVCDRIMFVE